jgi:hypothetical protein
MTPGPERSCAERSPTAVIQRRSRPTAQRSNRSLDARPPKVPSTSNPFKWEDIDPEKLTYCLSLVEQRRVTYRPTHGGQKVVVKTGTFREVGPGDLKTKRWRNIRRLETLASTASDRRISEGEKWGSGRKRRWSEVCGLRHREFRA